LLKAKQNRGTQTEREEVRNIPNKRRNKRKKRGISDIIFGFQKLETGVEPARAKEMDISKTTTKLHKLIFVFVNKAIRM
jgi:hypothetical protein